MGRNVSFIKNSVYSCFTDVLKYNTKQNGFIQRSLTNDSCKGLDWPGIL